MTRRSYLPIFLPILWLVGCGLQGPESKERRTELGATEPSSLGFSMADVLGTDALYEGQLEWFDGGLHFDIESSTESTMISHRLVDLSGSVFEIEPCPNGFDGVSTGNVQPDCEVRLEAQVSVQLTTEDGNLDETWPATLSAFARDHWKVRGESPTVAGALTVQPVREAGPLVFTCAIEKLEESVSGSLGGHTGARPGETDTPRASGAGTGFRAAEWTAREVER